MKLVKDVSFLIKVISIICIMKRGEETEKIEIQKIQKDKITYKYTKVKI